MRPSLAQLSASPRPSTHTMSPRLFDTAFRLHEQPSRYSHRLLTSGMAAATIEETMASVRSISSFRVAGAALEPLEVVAGELQQAEVVPSVEQSGE